MLPCNVVQKIKIANLLHLKTRRTCKCCGNAWDDQIVHCKKPQTKSNICNWINNSLRQNRKYHISIYHSEYCQTQLHAKTNRNRQLLLRCINVQHIHSNCNGTIDKKHANEPTICLEFANINTYRLDSLYSHFHSSAPRARSWQVFL